MSTDIQHIRIGLTNNHPCSYLPERQERVAVALDERLHTEENYQLLMANGFRRSGDTIYKTALRALHRLPANSSLDSRR